MQLILASLVILLLSALAGLVPGKFGGRSRIPIHGLIAASVLNLFVAVPSLFQPVELRFAIDWSLPFAQLLSIGVDPLSAFFLIPISIVSPLVGLYGLEYMRHSRYKEKAGITAFFLNVMVSGMVLVVVSRNAIVFLLAWEIMSVSSYFLVVTNYERRKTCAAGWVYLVATHLGTAFILGLFAMLGSGEVIMDFDSMKFDAPTSGMFAAGLFVCALVGFGTKAGLAPFHVWLPEAYPAAPSHVTAIMSGVMSKMGVYGFLRALMLIGGWPEWWGHTVVLIGAATAVFGIVMALAQSDLKRLLAYSSVENMGIIFMGIGLGMVGVSRDSPMLAVLGFGGAIMHVLNHSVFKSLLFLCAGAVISTTGTGLIDLLGGLGKRMRMTSVGFLAGAMGICALPPLNGFISEFMIFCAAGAGLVSKTSVPSCAAVVGCLALSGGLALACFAKAFGCVFLGEARSKHGLNATDPGKAMIWPILLLASLCAIIGLGAPFAALMVVGPVTASLCPGTDGAVAAVQKVLANLSVVSAAGFGFLALATAVYFFRHTMSKSRGATAAPTWDCGFAAPTPRIQYTGSSFSQPLTKSFHFLLRSKSTTPRLKGVLPSEGDFSTETHDIYQEKLFGPLMLWTRRMFQGLDWLETNSVHVSILYIIVALGAVLAWRFILN